MWSAAALRSRNLGVYRYAEQFHDVASKAGSPIVRGYLLGHSLELYLKAYLLHFKMGATELKKKFGHDLTCLLDAAKSHGIEKEVHISLQLANDLRKLNKVYSSKDLEYFSIFFIFIQPEIPGLARLFRFAGSLQKLIGKMVKQ